jgi:hypothetical protein
MEKEHRGYSIRVAAAEHTSLSLGYHYNAEEEEQVDHQQYTGAYKSKSLAYGTKDKVGALLGHKVVAGLGTAQ